MEKAFKAASERLVATLVASCKEMDKYDNYIDKHEGTARACAYELLAGRLDFQMGNVVESFTNRWAGVSLLEYPNVSWSEIEKIKMWCDATYVILGGDTIFGTDFEKLYV